MSDQNTPEQPRNPPVPRNLPPAPQSFTHPAAPLFPAAAPLIPAPAPQSFTHPAVPLLPAPTPTVADPKPLVLQRQQPLAQPDNLSTAGNPDLAPVAVSFDETADLIGPAPVRPSRLGVRAKTPPARNGGLNTVSCVAAAAAAASVSMMLLPPVQFAAPTVSAIALTVALWGFTLPRFKRAQSVVAGGIAVAAVIAVAALSIIGGAPSANGHEITFEVTGSSAPAGSSVTWATDGAASSETKSEKNASLPWKATVAAVGKSTGSSYSVWLEAGKGEALGADADFACAVLVDGVAVSRSAVIDGNLACSYYGDVDHPENVDARR